MVLLLLLLLSCLICECYSNLNHVKLSSSDLILKCRELAGIGDAEVNECYHVLIGYKYLEVGKILFEFGRIEEAVDVLRQAIRYDGNNGKTHQYLAKNLLLLGENFVDEGLNHCEIARKLSPELFNDYIGSLEVANLYIYKDSPHLSISWINIAAKIANDHGNDDANLFHHHIFAARAFEAGNKYEDALKAALNAVKMSENFRVYAVYCTLLLRLQRPKECKNFIMSRTLQRVEIEDLVWNFHIKNSAGKYFNSLQDSNRKVSKQQRDLILKLRQDLYQRQHPQSCEYNRLLIVNFNNFEIGLGLQINTLAALLSYSYRTNRTLVTADEDNWPNIEMNSIFCPKKSFTCLFNPISNCTSLAAPSIVSLKTMTGVITEDDKIRDLSVNLKDFYLNFSGTEAIYVPNQYSALGLLLWRSILSDFVFKPKSDIVALQSKNVFDIGVHIRRGLKYQEEPPKDIKYYIEAIEYMMKHNNKEPEVVQTGNYEWKFDNHPDRNVKTSIFLATDDDFTRNQMNAKLKSMGILIEVINNINNNDDDDNDDDDDTNVVHSFDYESHVTLSARRGNATKLTINAINDIYSLSLCNSFIGTFSSGFSRLAYQLQTARLVEVPISISLDSMFHILP